MNPVDTTQRTEKEIWIELAELFFLDTEPSETDYERVAELLKKNGWSREHTKDTLVQLIAPNAGANLGYLVWPVIGEWSGFDREQLCSRISRSQILRAKYPRWYFLISDWWSGRMLVQLQMNRLLDRLGSP